MTRTATFYIKFKLQYEWKTILVCISCQKPMIIYFA